MATSDLKNALGNIHGQIDPDLQTPIRDAVLSQLDDGSTEVQNIAVSCLSAIVLKFKPNEIYKIANKLGQSLIEGMPEMRDSYADGLKTIISSVEMSLGSGISSHIIDHLLNGLSTINHKDLDKANFCLDVLECLLQTFGSMTASSHKDILECLTQILENENSGMRKRAAAVLASLVLVLDDELFHSMITGIIKKIGETKNNKDKLRNYIQTIGVVGRNAGVRIGKYLNKIVPLLVKFCKERVGRNDEETIILRENCLAAFESLILECPSGITPHIDSLVNLAIEYISYDPN